jgi:hypothetical protein
MAKVITFSSFFPKGHIHQFKPTYFVEKFWASRHTDFEYKAPLKELDWVDLSKEFEPKHHTIRIGNRWKKGDYFSPRIWSGRPYFDKQLTIAPDTLITEVYNITIELNPSCMFILLPTEFQSQFQMLSVGEVAKNDGLTYDQFVSWFNPKQKSDTLDAQIICWNEAINY